MIKLDPRASEAIKMALTEKGLPLEIRVEVRSTGCCDSSLGIAAEQPEEHDLVEQADGLRIGISSVTHKLVGDVSVAYVDDAGQQGFLVTSDRPLNEWAGFAPGSIRFK